MSDSSEKIESFSDALDALDAGQASAEANRAMRDVLARCHEIARDHGKSKASLTIRLDFKTEGQNGKTTVDYKIDTKHAPVPRQSSVLYASETGALSDHDPRQLKLSIKARTPRKENV